MPSIGSPSDTASYPCELRLTKNWSWFSGLEFTGEYSTDGGTTWTELDTAQLWDADWTQDVALIGCSFDASTKSRVEFDDFTVQ